MLILNDEHRKLVGMLSLEEQCHYCSKPLAAYPLIMSDDTEQPVYHTTCAIQLAADIMVDLFTFFSPPAPYRSLFVLSAEDVNPHTSPEGV